MTERQFAIDVVRQLKATGFEAFWAGGCVRDWLLGIEPSDFDVATNAHPDQVRQLFGHGRTLAVGAAFGVIIVLSPDRKHQIEVATFRSDATYSDGRRPDSVTFSTPELDAQRRDFTINGMFYDPIREKVIDYVGGQADLAVSILRAIGDADARIAEDKLRMLRAVRIAAKYGFEIEPQTYQAIARHSSEVVGVSGERLAVELRKSLETKSPGSAVETWADTGLMHVLFPEIVESWYGACSGKLTLKMLKHPKPTSWIARLGCILWPVTGSLHLSVVGALRSRFRLSNDDSSALRFCLASQDTLCEARELPWSRVQPLLVSEPITHAVELLEHRTEIGQANLKDVDWLRERLEWPPSRLNPAPLVTGLDLQQAGFHPSPQFKSILEETRDRQLDGQLVDREEALNWIQSNW